ncbi:MAG: hypothetical protein R3F10_06185 [Lysobacteraceae bacterium]
MSLERTAEMLLAACLKAGVDPELIFDHYDEATCAPIATHWPMDR